MAITMIDSSFYELISYRRFGRISIGMPLDVISNFQEIECQLSSWNKSKFKSDEPSGWFDLGDMELHAGPNDGSHPELNLIIIKTKLKGVSFLDRSNQFRYDAQGVFIGQRLSEAEHIIRDLSIPFRNTDRSDDLSIFRIGESSSLICYGNRGEELIYQIEVS